MIQPLTHFVYYPDCGYTYGVRAERTDSQGRPVRGVYYDLNFDPPSRHTFDSGMYGDTFASNAVVVPVADLAPAEPVETPEPVVVNVYVDGVKR